MSTYLATGDSDGVRRLFEKGGIARAVGFARDAFNSESQTATPEALVGWTAVLLQASFDAKMTEVSEEVVALAVEWASSPQVSPSLAKLPPESLVRAIASTSSHQALTAGRRLVDLAHSDQTSPLPDYTVTVLRALSANRGVLQERHSELGRQMRERLADLVTQNRQQVLLRVSTLSQGVSGGDWGFWWDQNLGSKLVESITGTGNSSEDSEIINYVARPEYEPSQQERQAAVRTSVRLFQQHASSGLDAFTNIGLDLVNRVALSGQPLPLMSEQDTEVFAAFITRLSDPDQKLTSLIPTVRLVSFSGASAQKVVLEKGLQQAMPAFSSQHLGKVLTVLVDVGLVAEEGWGASLLRRCVELRDAALFSTVAEKSRHPGAISSGLEAAFQTDQSFGDSLMGKIQAYCDSGTFADALDRRVAAAGPDVASTVRLVNAIQSLSQKPELQDSVWHTIATRIEQGVTDFSDPGNAQALRRAVNSTFLAWLPEADQRHLADFATAVVRGAQGQPNDPPETTQAKAEAGLVFEPICSEAQGATIANGVAHVLAWPSLSPTVVSILVSALTSRPRLLALVKDEALEAIAFTRDSRTDEGKAFLESLLQARPPKPPKPSKTSSKGKPGKDS